jgi:serine protease Do
LLGTLWALSRGSICHAEDISTLEQDAFNAAVEAVEKSVVQIRTVGGLEQVDDQLLAQGPTTGLIVSGDGYIVSSAFNFAQRPTSILVRLPGGDQQPAEIVGRDTNRMLVLLKVESHKPLPAPEAAPLDEVRPGDWALALGRTYQADRVNVSVGIVSALARMHGRAVQTDANVSAANYGGPLVDIRGRVLGVLVPMAPQSGTGETSEVAGAEFYDSGIGFAVPLEHVLASLPRWIEEGDLKRGLLGVGMTSGNAHATPPTLTAVWPGSPAAKAGWREGDQIVSVDGRPVETQTQLRFQIVPRYAGDKLKVTLRRGAGDDAKEIETEVTLAAELEPYRHAFLGILPERDKPTETDDEEVQGVAIRAIWPESPAEKADLKAGDRITRLGDKTIRSASDAMAQLNAKNPNDKLDLIARRGDKELELTLELDELPTNILSSSELPHASDKDAEVSDAAEASATSIELRDLRLPEFPQRARYFRPEADNSSPGLLLWLSDGQKGADEALAAAWESVCRRDNVALVVAPPLDRGGWTADDLEYLAQLLPTAARRLHADPRRIVIAGEGKAGQMAYVMAVKARKWVRGVAVIDSPLPRTLELPPNSPNERLAVLSIHTENSPLATLIRQDLRKQLDAGYPATPVVRRTDSDGVNPLDAVTRGKTARWIDGLDRF